MSAFAETARHRSSMLRGGADSARRAVGISVVASLAGQALLICSGVASARALGPEGRGQLALILLTPPIVAQVVSLGLPLGVTYAVAQTGDARAVNDAAKRLFALLVVGATLVEAVLGGSIAMAAAPHLLTVALLSSLAAGGIVATQYSTALLQGQTLFGRFNAMRQLPAALYVVGCLGILVLPTGESVEAFAIAWTLAYALGAVAAWLVALRAQSCPRDNSVEPSLGSMVRFGLKGFVGSISAIEMFRLDQAMVAAFLSTSALGIYVVASAFSNLPRFVGQSVGTVAFPYVAKAASSRSALTSTRLFVLVTTLLTGLVAVVLVVAMPWLLPTLFGSEFKDGVVPAAIIVVAAALTSVRRTAGDSARGAGYPLIGTWAEVASWVLLVPGLILAGQTNSIEAVAWTLLIVAAVVLVGTTIVVEFRLRSASRGRSIVGEP
jgi:O-antigen/teichoic acid export membrane protein